MLHRNEVLSFHQFALPNVHPKNLAHLNQNCGWICLEMFLVKPYLQRAIPPQLFQLHNKPCELSLDIEIVFRVTFQAVLSTRYGTAQTVQRQLEFSE